MESQSSSDRELYMTRKKITAISNYTITWCYLFIERYIKIILHNYNSSNNSLDENQFHKAFISTLHWQILVWIFRLELKQSRLVDQRGKSRSTLLHKSVALLTHMFESVSPYRRVAAFGKRLNDLVRSSAFPVRVPGVMQSVPMPITKPGAVQCGSGRRDVRRRDVILWSGADLPARACINWLTARLVETGIKHARLRVYAPRHPNFSSERSLLGMFVPRWTPREYATTTDRQSRGEETRWREPARSWMSLDRDWHFEMAERCRNARVSNAASSRDCWRLTDDTFLFNSYFWFSESKIITKRISLG